MLADDTRAVSFTDFVEAHEMRLRQSLTAAFGPQLGREAVAEALAYGWEHWDRVSDSENIAGYLYRVGYNRALRMKPKMRRFPRIDTARQPWIEPGLPHAFETLPEQQRVVVLLLHGYEWSMSEVAEYLGISKSTVQTHSERGLGALRRTLGVEV
jgi:RNA polymerase sigma factor (sigma-70 family)